MSCSAAKSSSQYHGWECKVSGGACMFLVPNSKACAEEFGESPYALVYNIEKLKLVLFNAVTILASLDSHNHDLTISERKQINELMLKAQEVLRGGIEHA